MPDQKQIAAYHKRVAADVRRILNICIKFQLSDRWAKARNGAELVAELQPEDCVSTEIALRGRQGKEHRVFVFPLNQGSDSLLGTFWVSWYENWRKQNSGDFVLLNAGWTMFEGLPGNQDKIQVLRADWDQLQHEKGSKDAGQPHWHFDHDIFLAMEQERIEVGNELIELTEAIPDPSGEAASVGSIHLAMGAWNDGVEHPQCWQRSCDDCDRLRDWCIKTLLYLKDQVEPD